MAGAPTRAGPELRHRRMDAWASAALHRVERGRRSRPEELRSLVRFPPPFVADDPACPPACRAQTLSLPTKVGTRLLRAGPALLRAPAAVSAAGHSRTCSGVADACRSRQSGTRGELAAVASRYAAGRHHPVHCRSTAWRASAPHSRRGWAAIRIAPRPRIEVPQVPARA